MPISAVPLRYLKTRLIISQCRLVGLLNACETTLTANEISGLVPVAK